MKNIICFLLGHKLPKWKKNPKESLYVSVWCLRCGKEQIERNFDNPRG